MRIPSGIAGLDPLIGGGFVKGSVVLITGGAGSGKTTLCVQSLYSAAEGGEKVLFLSLDQRAHQLLQHFGPMFGKLKDHLGKSFLIAETHADSLDSLIADIEYLTQSYSVQRIAIDPTTLLKIFSPEDVRIAINKICSALQKSKCTSLLTSESSFEQEMLADCVLSLDMSRVRGFIARRLHVKKMRGSEHSQFSHPYEITQFGIKVHPF